MANRDNPNRNRGQQGEQQGGRDRGGNLRPEKDIERKHGTERGHGGEGMRNKRDESDRGSSDRLKDASRLPE